MHVLLPNAKFCIHSAFGCSSHFLPAKSFSLLIITEINFICVFLHLYVFYHMLLFLSGFRSCSAPQDLILTVDAFKPNFTNFTLLYDQLSDELKWSFHQSLSQRQKKTIVLLWEHKQTGVILTASPQVVHVLVHVVMNCRHYWIISYWWCLSLLLHQLHFKQV